MAIQDAEIRFASAVTTEPQTLLAIDEVTQTIRQELGQDIDLLLVFSSMHHREGFGSLYAQMSAVLRPRVMAACTCEGVIGSSREVEAGPGLSVLAARLPGVTLEPFNYEQIDWQRITESPASLRDCLAIKGPEPEAFMMLADPFSTPMVRLLPAFDEAFPGAVVVGGMVSGGRLPQENRLLLNGTVLMEGAVGIAIGGPVSVRTTVSQGCRPVGKPLVITRAKRHVVQELGGRNALAVVRDMAQQLDAADRDLMQAKGLQVGRVINEYKGRFGRGDFLIRELMGVDTDEGYLAIGDPQVRVGQTIQFHLRDQRTAREDLALLLQRQAVYGPGAGGLLISCNGRGRGLFNESNVDVNTVRRQLGDMPLAGFFAVGEFGPVGGANFIHGHTACLAVFRPRL